MIYEVVESIDPRDRPGAPVQEHRLGVFGDEQQAIAKARAAREAFVARGIPDYAWWIVREQGATLARWIADSQSAKEYVLDLRTGSLVEV